MTRSVGLMARISCSKGRTSRSPAAMSKCASAKSSSPAGRSLQEKLRSLRSDAPMLRRRKLTPIPAPSGRNNSRNSSCRSVAGKRLISSALPPVREKPKPSMGWKRRPGSTATTGNPARIPPNTGSCSCCWKSALRSAVVSQYRRRCIPSSGGASPAAAAVVLIGMSAFLQQDMERGSSPSSTSTLRYPPARSASASAARRCRPSTARVLPSRAWST